jgi:cation diffusion facilitator family transporter
MSMSLLADLTGVGRRGENAGVTAEGELTRERPAARLPGPAGSARAVRRTLGVILVANVVVVAIKLIVGWRTDTLSVLGAALESSLDTLNNIIGMVLVTLAARAPDEDHPYGHEKFETVGALAIVGFLSISCFELLQQGLETLRLRQGPRPGSVLEITLLASTVAVNLFVVWYERRRGVELRSPFLLADAAHTGSDTYVTLLALASMLLARAGLGRLDAFVVLIVAVIIAVSGYRILRGTIPILVDERAVDAERIRELLRSIPGIAEVRDVRSRFTPSGRLFAELTIVVDGSLSVADAHTLADAAEERIAAAIGASEVTVHVEPR